MRRREGLADQERGEGRFGVLLAPEGMTNCFKVLMEGPAASHVVRDRVKKYDRQSLFRAPDQDLHQALTAELSVDQFCCRPTLLVDCFRFFASHSLAPIANCLTVLAPMTRVPIG